MGYELEVEEYSDSDDDRQICEGCGRDVNGYEGGGCPLCCGSTYAPGSEQCDFCPYSEECARNMAKL
jgi:predicted amidophosphoribosyltransferase